MIYFEVDNFYLNIISKKNNLVKNDIEKLIDIYNKTKFDAKLVLFKTELSNSRTFNPLDRGLSFACKTNIQMVKLFFSYEYFQNNNFIDSGLSLALSGDNYDIIRFLAVELALEKNIKSKKNLIFIKRFVDDPYNEKFFLKLQVFLESDYNIQVFRNYFLNKRNFINHVNLIKGDNIPLFFQFIEKHNCYPNLIDEDFKFIKNLNMRKFFFSRIFSSKINCF